MAFAVLLLILGVLTAISKLFAPEKLDYTEKDSSIYYFSADYDENISNDIVYMSKNREVFFVNDSGLGEYLTEKDGELSTVKGVIYNYFRALKNGSAEEHESLLSASYKEHFVVQKSFTPQKVYDIQAAFLTGDISDGVYYEKYAVSYKIYRNNGTYRADVASDVAKTMVFEIVNVDGKALINSIVVNMDKGE